MLRKNIEFYYYSGTGNTLLVVKEMSKIFTENGLQVNLHPIEDSDPLKIDTEAVIGLAFPVAFQSTFPFVWDFLNALPSTVETPVFMVDTMMSFSGAIVGPLKKVLTNKGYKCFGACEITMPNNWLPKVIDQKRNKEKTDFGLSKAREYAKSLVKDNTSWGRIPFLSKTFYNICCNSFVMDKAFATGKKITVNTDKCIKCGLCSRLCPVRNISMNEYPQWHNSCQLCMRCLSFCPVNAVTIPGKVFTPYRAVKASELGTKNRS